MTARRLASLLLIPLAVMAPEYVIAQGPPVGAKAITVPIDDGWRNFARSPDSRVVYVSSSLGNDANDGLSEARPKRSIAAGRALMRHQFPDWLLLRRGDSWVEPLGFWITSGRSATEPQLISTYGASPSRPLLLTGTANGMDITLGGRTPPNVDNIALVGIHFRAHTYTGTGGPAGLRFVHQGENYHIEDCFFEAYHTNVTIMGWPSGRFRNVVLRRCVIADAYTTDSSNSEGMFVSSIDRLRIEENVFDHNGWSETVSGAGGTIFRHGIYVQYGCTDVTVNGNIVSNSASHGLQLRPGGVANDNLFVRNSISLMIGAIEEQNGVTVEAMRNVILDGKNIDSANQRGWGLTVAHVRSGVVSHNIIANNTIGGSPVPVDITGNSGLGVRSFRFEHNIVSNWPGSLIIRGTPAQFPGFVFRGNELQNRVSAGALLDHSGTSSLAGMIAGENRFFSAATAASAWIRVGGNNHSVDSWKALISDTTSFAMAINYPSPAVSVGAYNALLNSGATHHAFMAEARQQSRSNWRPAYTARAVNAYVRGAFGRSVD